ncbi:GNAT family N-acetyltransferase [Streptomyces sp. NPDC088261]|uniref:GNAT family N-acetyltransferase n=1 Tax=Streptomyces sp. NPDC088261 TaxID=3365851 RepID=UPI00382E6D4B
MTTTLRPEPIETERLTLVPLRVEHAREMAVVLSDPALHGFIGGTPETEAELRVRYTRMVGGSPDPEVSWCNWVLGLRTEGVEDGGKWRGGEGTLAGTVQATVTSAGPGSTPGQGAVAEIAWVVGTPWQGHGLASEAARGLVRWLEARGVGTVIAHIHPEHGASAAVARACGLTPTDRWHDGEVRWQRRLNG